VSVTVYATEAAVRALVRLAFAIRDALERARERVVKKEEERGPAVPPGYAGFLKVWAEGAAEERMYVWRGRGALEVRVPCPAGFDPRLPAIDLARERRPQRMHFTFQEAASEGWFREVEALAKMLERRGRGEGR